MRPVLQLRRRPQSHHSVVIADSGLLGLSEIEEHMTGGVLAKRDILVLLLAVLMEDDTTLAVIDEDSGVFRIGDNEVRDLADLSRALHQIPLIYERAWNILLDIVS